MGEKRRHADHSNYEQQHHKKRKAPASQEQIGATQDRSNNQSSRESLRRPYVVTHWAYVEDKSRKAFKGRCIAKPRQTH